MKILIYATVEARNLMHGIIEQFIWYTLLSSGIFKICHVLDWHKKMVFRVLKWHVSNKLFYSDISHVIFHIFAAAAHIKISHICMTNSILVSTTKIADDQLALLSRQTLRTYLKLFVN